MNTVVVGLTGGIGSGKSTVAAGLVTRGAILIDADAIVRHLQRPGQPVLTALVERFGEKILQVDGTLDRGALAAMVFNNKAALSDLNGIVHPPTGKEIRRQLKAAFAEPGPNTPRPSDSKRLVVLDIPLLAEGLINNQRPLYVVSGVMVVDTPTELAVERLGSSRGMSQADARARMANQLKRQERLSVADHVVVNSGTLEQLELRLDAAHTWAMSLEPTSPPNDD